jgi:hypothetical protein
MGTETCRSGSQLMVVGREERRWRASANQWLGTVSGQVELSVRAASSMMWMSRSAAVCRRGWKGVGSSGRVNKSFVKDGPELKSDQRGDSPRSVWFCKMGNRGQFWKGLLRQIPSQPEILTKGHNVEKRRLRRDAALYVTVSRAAAEPSGGHDFIWPAGARPGGR